MATNKDLIAKAESLGAQLGEPVETEELNNAQLTELVKTLTESVASLGSTPGDAPVVTGSLYTMAERCSICATKTRILGPGDDITPADLAGGREAFDQLVKKGKIVKK